MGSILPLVSPKSEARHGIGLNTELRPQIRTWGTSQLTTPPAPGSASAAPFTMLGLLQSWECSRWVTERLACVGEKPGAP